jgi:hypothetical protein
MTTPPSSIKDFESYASGSPSATIYIDAPPERVMSILKDLKSYPLWCPFTRKMDGECIKDTTITEHVQLNLKSTSRRLQRVIVSEANEVCLHWYSILGGSRSILFAQRSQFVVSEGNGTRYYTCDRMSGILSFLVLFLYFRTIQDGFKSIAMALKARSEEK